MLCAIESLLSAVVADGMTNTRHNSNRELVGQGIANMVTPLFGGIPATGAIARTATNIKSGAQTPVAGVVHGVVVLLTLLILAPYASLIPLASMAPVLMVVAWNMSERKEFMHVLKTKTGCRRGSRIDAGGHSLRKTHERGFPHQPRIAGCEFRSR